jgi:hypothetical protein
MRISVYMAERFCYALSRAFDPLQYKIAAGGVRTTVQGTVFGCSGAACNCRIGAWAAMIIETVSQYSAGFMCTSDKNM